MLASVLLYNLQIIIKINEDEQNLGNVLQRRSGLDFHGHKYITGLEQAYNNQK